MHLFLAFEDILESYSFFRIMIFICGIKGVGKLWHHLATSVQCLPSLCGILATEGFNSGADGSSHTPPYPSSPTPTHPPLAPPPPAGRHSAASAHSFFTSCSPLEVTTTSHPILPLSSSSTPFHAFLSFPFFFCPA